MECGRYIWYNVGRHYTCAGLQPTKGRQSAANRVHPAGSIMSEGPDIMSADIIPAPDCGRPKGGNPLFWSMTVGDGIRYMLLLLKNDPLLNIRDNGSCEILDFDRLPFALRKKDVTFIDFMEWAANRTLSIGRSYAKEILNSMRLSQNNRYAVCKACRGLSLEDSYWIKQDGDSKTWDEVSLFQNPLSLFITEISLSGKNIHYRTEGGERGNIHTPELTTLGASAKGWIRGEGGLCLHKVGKYEIPADEILSALHIPHIHYAVSQAAEIDCYLTEERKQWIEGVGEVIVNSGLFTTEDTAFVTFEEFQLFCGAYGLNAFQEAARMDRDFYLKMQVADYILNNNDRHEQNWGFFMDNASGKITGFCPLFDHDHAFAVHENVMSQTTEEPVLLYDAAAEAQKELNLDLSALDNMEKPKLLSKKQWDEVLERKKRLEKIGGFYI